MKPIEGFDGYFVCEQGRVFSKKRKAIREISQHPMKDGYLHVILFVGGKRHAVPVHREVLYAFCGPRMVGKVARHLDGDLTNNSASNLAWSTQHENILDKVAHGTQLRGEQTPIAKLTDEAVRFIRALPKYRGLFTDMGHRFGVSRVAVANAYAGRTWSHV